MRGRLFAHGRGVSMGYPVSSSLDDHWARLDEFEGSEYVRATAVALTEDGGSVPAQVYVHGWPGGDSSRW